MTAEKIDEILSEAKGQPSRESKEDKALRNYRNFFPESYKTEQMNDIIIKLLSKWKSGAIDV